MYIFNPFYDVSFRENKALYFKVKVGNPNFGMRFNLEIQSGDANLYIHYDHDRPSIAQHHWFDESDHLQKVLSVSNVKTIWTTVPSPIGFADTASKAQSRGN